jgi:mono/diheme cytochrome c family protein
MRSQTKFIFRGLISHTLHDDAFAPEHPLPAAGMLKAHPSLFHPLPMRDIAVKTLLRTLACLLLLAGLAALAVVAWARHAGGFSARATPTLLETVVARYTRSLSMPASAKSLQNPIADSSEVQHEAMAHYADHCASCHANDGSGDTMYGKGLYPKPPDLRLPATQKLGDGQLFYIVQNGVRLTGMPAFGSSNDDGTDSWKLVRFLRHLPKITPTEVEQMNGMNPKSPDELQEEKQEQEFLNGSPAAH